jgi:hypothetical protein
MSDQKFRFGLIKRSNEDPVPEDEPVFILRARDHLAVAAIEYYERLSLADGCNDYHQGGMVRVIAAFKEWAAQNPDKMKQPGVTRGL